MRRLLVFGVLALIVGLVWWGLRLLAPAPADQAPAPSPSASAPSNTPTVVPFAPSTSPTSSPSAEAEEEPADVEGHEDEEDGQDDHEHGDVVDPTASAQPRDKAQAAAFKQYERIATAFVKAYARPGADTTAEAWWAPVSDLLSEDARTIYAGTDPRNVPFTKVTGRAVVVPTEAPMHLLTIARVPTNAGAYLVEMQTGPEGIRVTRLTPEEDGQ